MRMMWWRSMDRQMVTKNKKGAGNKWKNQPTMHARLGGLLVRKKVNTGSLNHESPSAWWTPLGAQLN